jgi:hypothetical protein
MKERAEETAEKLQQIQKNLETLRQQRSETPKYEVASSQA